MTDRTCEELNELWRTVFGEPPSITADPSLTAEVLVRCLPAAKPYAPQRPSMLKLRRRRSR